MPKQKERVTIADVAEKAAVSAMTVSRVLNDKPGIGEETRRHVLQVMRELGYRPNRVARSLATARTLKIGVIVPSISSAYYASVLEGVERFFWEQGYHMLLCNTAANNEREEAILDFFEEDRVDGVMVFSSRMTAEQISPYLKHQRAAVMVNTRAEPGLAGNVRTDEQVGMTRAVEHLVSSGRCCLGYIGFDTMTYAGEQRLNAFLHAAQDMGLEMSPEQLATCDRRTGYEAALEILHKAPGVDGLICFNDEIAAGVLRACADLGQQVPDDVAVIGYDDIFLAEMLIPSLTTLRLKIDKDEIGARAAQMLLDRIEGDCACDEIVLEHELVVRESAP